MEDTEIDAPALEVRLDESGDTRQIFKIPTLSAGHVSHTSAPSDSPHLLNRFLKEATDVDLALAASRAWCKAASPS